MRFRRGDEIEVLSGEAGFLGSFYEARVVTKISKGLYIVEYKNLIKDDGSGRPLREIVSDDEMRPPPPPFPIPPEGLSPEDKVDAFDNDGWWSGCVVEKKESDRYVLHFHTTGETMTLPPSQLRGHQDWVEGAWVPSKIGT